MGEAVSQNVPALFVAHPLMQTMINRLLAKVLNIFINRLSVFHGLDATGCLLRLDMLHTSFAPFQKRNADGDDDRASNRQRGLDPSPETKHRVGAEPPSSPSMR